MKRETIFAKYVILHAAEKSKVVQFYTENNFKVFTANHKTIMPKGETGNDYWLFRVLE